MKETLRPFGAKRGQMPLFISLAGLTHPDPDYRVVRQESSVTVLEYVLSGKGYLELKGKRCGVEAGQIYLLRRGVPHDYGADSKEPYEKIFLNVAGPLCDNLLSSYDLEEGVYEDANLKGVFLEIPRLIASPLSEEDLQARLQGVFLQILCRLSMEKSLAQVSKEALALKKLLDANPHRSVSAKELSKTVFRSPDYCRKLFFRSFGSTPYAYQLEQKTERAKILLRETSLSVGEVAGEVGYEDLHYFSNLFFSKTGLRPLQYRKKYRP